MKLVFVFVGSAKEEVLSNGEPNVLNLDGTEWVELFVREMMNASDMKDAKARAARALEALEKSINARTGTEAMQNLQQVSHLSFFVSFFLHSSLVIIAVAGDVYLSLNIRFAIFTRKT